MTTSSSALWTVSRATRGPVCAVNGERWAAASGYLVVLFGIAGAAFERGGPPLNAPVEQTIAFFSTYRSELLLQSLMFVWSAGAYIWFFGVLRMFLLQAEGGPGMLSTIAFGAGIISAGIQMVFQGFQVALAVASNHPVEPTLAVLVSNATFALSVIGYVPVAVMLTAVAVVSLRDRAFPTWLGWLSAFAAVVHVVMSIGLVVGGGPLVPGGTLTYSLYAVSLLWLVATTTVMVVRSGRPHHLEAVIREDDNHCERSQSCSFPSSFHMRPGKEEGPCFPHSS